MAIQLITPPSGMPVTVSQLKDQSRITVMDTAQEDLISLYIQTANNYAQRRLNRQFVTATYLQVADQFPVFGDSIELDIAPVQNVVSVEYIDGVGDLVEWDPLHYDVDYTSEPCRIRYRYGGFYPIILPNLNAVQVTFVAGYGNASAVPAEIKTAILMLAAHNYENREASTDVKLLPVPFAVDAFLDLYRWHATSIFTAGN